MASQATIQETTDLAKFLSQSLCNEAIIFSLLGKQGSHFVYARVRLDTCHLYI